MWGAVCSDRALERLDDKSVSSSGPAGSGIAILAGAQVGWCVRWSLMSTADVPEDYELVVADDGSIPAEQIARLGLGPGAHLRVVPASGAWSSPRRKTAKGILAGKVDGEALVGALQDAKGERVALLDLDE